MLLLQISVILPQEIPRIIKVYLHDAATLPCNQTCSDQVTWIGYRSHVTWFGYPKADDILAQCDQTSCQSKEGFHMSHDQYLKGDLSLTITDVDYTKTAWYTCECDRVRICDMSLHLEPLSLAIPVNKGQSLTMDMPVLKPVEVFFTSIGDASSNRVRLYIIGRPTIYDIGNEYKNRMSFSFSLQLRQLKESDSGVYTIQNAQNDEILARVNVNASSVQPGETMTLQLPLPLIMFVSFNKSDEISNSVRICTISWFYTKCISEYERTVLLSLSLQLKDLKESDSGIYTIRDIWNDDVIATYTVTVNGVSRVSQSVEVKLNENTTLTCNKMCSGLVIWTVFHKPGDILAQCNQTSCQSKEGFHMSHDQYLKGNLSLTITGVDYTKRAVSVMVLTSVM
ncbi:uncharacterized protein LOC113591846 [Electrophorus electricus]|uniref:uncharacterized protein LOC113591846 n=1 Tax=Electrophorus electricus TaxID=8005 RepID=UPI0015D08371|nr:uncharacterized protein LOC113591846 [Electrophorus electricus]XP_035382116.1 uncharacterized protein LOC113591846 [Electrophorus electricus]XP_035382117.1 uncharacterized protein LOC113591846 [Electrophorus electricus]